VASPLSHRLIFPLTVYGQCTHHSSSWLEGAGGAEILIQISAFTGNLTSNLSIGSPAC